MKVSLISTEMGLDSYEELDVSEVLATDSVLGEDLLRLI